MVDIWRGKNYYYYYGKKTNSHMYISVSIHYKRGITLKILDKILELERENRQLEDILR
jgi:transcriptional regulator of met regulon